MSSKITGVLLALAVLFAGGIFFGWKGVVLAMTGIVFWLLMQFSRLMRIMRAAGESPVGHVDSAVMLNARLREGMRLLEVIPLTRSLGQKLDSPAEGGESYAWTDAGGSRVELHLLGGRLQRWTLTRPETAETADASDSADTPGAQ